MVFLYWPPRNFRGEKALLLVGSRTFGMMEVDSTTEEDDDRCLRKNTIAEPEKNNIPC
jgi:hypothetical protein